MKQIDIKEKDIEEFCDEFGIGPCESIAVLLREKGYGQIEAGLYGTQEDNFSHYWIRTPEGKIIDPAINSKNGEYLEISKLDNNEFTDNIYKVDQEEVNFWRNKI